VTELLAELAAEVPFVFVATAVNVYAVPFVKPVTTNGDDAPVAVSPPGLDVTVNPVIVDPPVAPAVKSTETCVLPAVTESIVGACGAVVAVTSDDAIDAADVPKEFIAITVYVYCVLDCKPVTVTGEDTPVPV
jgi:hypothetical protein